MSQDIRIEDWQWERLMEVLGAIDQNTQPTVTTISTAKPDLPNLPPAYVDRLREDALARATARAEAAEARVQVWEGMAHDAGILGNEVARVKLILLGTTNPDPAGVWVLESEHKRVMEIMGRYEDASVEIPAVPELRSADHHSHRIWTFAKWLRDMLVKARADLEQQKNHPGWMDRIRRDRQEERERIIALLDCEGDMPDGCPALLVRNVTSGSTLNAAQLRAVLEP